MCVVNGTIWNETSPREIWTKMQSFSVTNMRLEMSTETRRHFRRSLNVIKTLAEKERETRENHFTNMDWWGLEHEQSQS